MWADDSDDEEVETWDLTIVSQQRDRIKVRMDYGDGEYATMTFDRISEADDTGAYASNILGGWFMRDMSPWDNEYVQSIRFNRDGSLEGNFREGDGDTSHFRGTYVLRGRSLTIYATWDENYDEESEVWNCTVISLSKDQVTVCMYFDSDYSVIMDFDRRS